MIASFVSAIICESMCVHLLSLFCKLLFILNKFLKMNCQFLTTNGVMGAAKYVATFLYIKNIHIFVHNLQLSRQCNLTKEFRCLVEKCKTGHCCHSLKILTKTTIITCICLSTASLLLYFLLNFSNFYHLVPTIFMTTTFCIHLYENHFGKYIYTYNNIHRNTLEKAI